MTTALLASFLVVYAAASALATVFLALRGAGAGRYVRATVSLVLLAGAVAAASAASAGNNSVVRVGLELLRLDRTHVIAVAAAACCGLLAGFAAHGFSATRAQRAASYLVQAGAIVFLAMLVLKEVISPYLANPAGGGLVEQPVTPGFRLEEVCQLSITPTALAVAPDGAVLVSGYAGIAFHGGVIVRLEPSAKPGTFQEVQIAESLNRPHGLAFFGRDLYVSRAGQLTRAVKGRLIHENTGFVTRLQDMGGTGKLDYYTDVITALPGAQPPDGLHQNNGLAFDDKGFLYVTAGMPSDHGPSAHPYAGTIVRAKADGSEMSIFARGFRNPYGITVGPNGDLFCTDNDADGLTNLGDALFHVLPGGHHGHPYTGVGKGLEVNGIVKPLLRSQSLQGLAYVPSGALPSGYDDCLYAAALAEGHVKRVRLQRTAAGYQATMDQFAAIPGVLNLAAAPRERALYACSLVTKKVYRIVPE